MPENVAFVRVHTFSEFNSFAMDECLFIYLFLRFVRWFLFEFGLMIGERILLRTFWSSYIFSNGNDLLRPQSQYFKSIEILAADLLVDHHIPYPF